jgi:hypothetical protein
MHVSAVRAHHEDVALSAEGDLPAVGRERRGERACGLVGELSHVRAVRPHGEDLPVAALPADEGDPLAVWREVHSRVDLVAVRVLDDLPLAGAVGSDREDGVAAVAESREGDFAARRRERGIEGAGEVVLTRSERGDWCW